MAHKLRNTNLNNFGLYRLGTICLVIWECYHSSCYLSNGDNGYLVDEIDVESNGDGIYKST
jgi:hypothetical protein